VKFTNNQKRLADIQEEDPLMWYVNPKTGKNSFGLIRLGRGDIYTTLSLQPLLGRGNIEITGKVSITLKTLGEIEANIIRLVGVE
jgi:hypothetical protein